MTIRHLKVITAPDDPDYAVSTSEWNDAHVDGVIGAAGDGVTDDRAAIQAAIDAAAAAGGGYVFLSAGTYLLGGSLVMKRGVSIGGVYPGTTSVHPDSWDLGWTVTTGTILTYPGGTVFTQDMSGGNGTASAVDGILIENLGFDDVGSIMSCGATNKTGLAGSIIQHILGSNITGIAFDLTNIAQIEMSFIKTASTFRLMRITGDYDNTVVYQQPGNSTFRNLYAFTTAAGHPEKTVQLRTIDRNGHGTYMGLIKFRDLQVNKFGSVAQTGGHLSIEGAALSCAVVSCVFEDVDFEGPSARSIEQSNTVGNRFDIQAITTESAIAFYQRNSQYTHVACQSVTVTVDSDAGSAPTFWNGAISSRTGPVPIGIYYDGPTSTPKLSTGSLNYTEVLTDTTQGTWTMPYTHMDFNTALGGGIMERHTQVDANTFDQDILTLGFVVLTFAGAVAVTLPTAVGVKGQTCTYKKTGASGTVTLTRRNSETIDGATTNTWLDTQYKYITLQSNGANWLIVGKG